MKDLKRHQIHRLPTEIKAKDWRQQIVVLKDTSFAKDGIGLSVNNTENHQDKTEILSLLDATCIPQHLYFTPSDEEIKRNPSINEIKEGDWFYNSMNNIVVKATNRYSEMKNPIPHRKIIATTDPKLTIEKSLEGIKGKVPFSLPQPTEEFIKAYCEQGGIDEVDVEYDVMDISTLTSNTDDYPNLDIVTIKVDPIHNTVITHRIEEKKYSASEVVKMFWDCHNGVLDEFQLKWIKENL